MPVADPSCAKFTGRGARDRLLFAAEHATGIVPADLAAVQLADTAALTAALNEHLGVRVIVAGTLERRLVLIESADRNGWTVADLSGASHDMRAWPTGCGGFVRHRLLASSDTAGHVSVPRMLVCVDTASAPDGCQVVRCFVAWARR